MAAIVTCKYCHEKFDRLKESYIQIKHGRAFRYGHADCYIKEKAAGREKETYTIWDPKSTTTCFWCHEAIYPNDPDVDVMP